MALSSSSSASSSSPSIRSAVRIEAYVALATTISVAMTLFLKWFLHDWTGTGFPFATTMTCLTMFLQWLFSHLLHSATRAATKRGALASSSPPAAPPLSRTVYWTLAVPIGLCTSLDFLCCNLSFAYITVTLFTIVKAASHVWTLLFSIWLGHQRATWPLCCVVVLICSGIALSSYGATAFDLRGVLLVLAASIFGTLRWVLTQSLLQAVHKEHSSATSTTPSSSAVAKTKILMVVHYISPSSALGLLPLAAVFDGDALLRSEFLRRPDLLGLSLVLIGGCGCLAFALLLVKIVLIEKTSALTLGISGSVRDLVQILLAVALFGDSLGGVNIVGLGIATGGILLYTLVMHKTNDSRASQPSTVDGGEEVAVEQDLEAAYAPQMSTSCAIIPCTQLDYEQPNQSPQRDARV